AAAGAVLRVRLAMLHGVLLLRGSSRLIYRATILIASYCDITPPAAGHDDPAAYRPRMQARAKKGAVTLATPDHADPAAFRPPLREFLRFSEGAATEVGLTSRHYQAMLFLRACPAGRRVTINDLAQDLLIKHNSAVGLVDRLARERLVGRMPSRADRRE